MAAYELAGDLHSGETLPADWLMSYRCWLVAAFMSEGIRYDDGHLDLLIRSLQSSYWCNTCFPCNTSIGNRSIAV